MWLNYIFQTLHTRFELLRNTQITPIDPPCSWIPGKPCIPQQLKTRVQTPFMIIDINKLINFLA